MFDKRWNKRFMRLAKHISTWSKDPSTKVGAVLINRQRHIVGTGYNGFPPGVRDVPERYANRPLKYKLVCHAERNALMHATQRDLAGCTLYTTFMPCATCAGMIIQAGIKRVMCPRPSDELLERWKEDLEATGLMFTEAGVMVLYAPEPAKRAAPRVKIVRKLRSKKRRKSAA